MDSEVKLMVVFFPPLISLLVLLFVGIFWRADVELN